MEVEVKLEVEDWRNFNTYICNTQSKALNESPKLKKLILNMLLWLFIAMVMMTALRSTDFLMKFHWQSALIALIFPLFIFIEFLKQNKKIQEKLRPSENGLLLSKQSYVINEEGIVNKNSGYVGTYPWSLIKKLERSNGLIMLFIDDIQAHLFPEEKLDNPDLFFEFITEKYENAKNLVTT